MIRQGSLSASLKKGLTLTRKKDDAARRKEVSEALARDTTARFPCKLSDATITGLLVFVSPQLVVFVQGAGEELRIVETIVLEQVTRYHRDGPGFILRWDKKSEACFLLDDAEVGEVLLASFDRLMLRLVAGASATTFFSPPKETLRRSLAPESSNTDSTDVEESEDEAETLLMDRSAVSRFPARSSLTQRTIGGTRFVGFWVIRLKKAISDFFEKVPCIIVASGQGLAVLMPSLRLFKPIYWATVPSFGSNKDSFGIFEVQANKVNKSKVAFCVCCLLLICRPACASRFSWWRRSSSSRRATRRFGCTGRAGANLRRFRKCILRREN
jgi:hypothetical protein